MNEVSDKYGKGGMTTKESFLQGVSKLPLKFFKCLEQWERR